VTSLALEGFTVGITADRRSEEQASMLARAGATIVHGPVMVTHPVVGGDELRSATAELVARPPHVLIATTGIGMRGWLNAAEAWGCAADLHAALTQSQIVARGPKAAGMLAGADLPVWRREPSERLDALIANLRQDGLLAGRRVAIQLYGSASAWAIEELRDAGADVVALPVYRWELHNDTNAAARLIDMTIEGRIDAVTFTSPPAVRFCLQLAESRDVRDKLLARLNGPAVAVCVGPVTAEAAKCAGIDDPVAPERGRLGLLVHAAIDALSERCLSLDVDGRAVLIRGNTVVVDDTLVELAHRERQLLDALTNSLGVVVPRSRLLRDVWGAGEDASRALEVTVARLRHRLGPIGAAIIAHPRRGYRFDASIAPQTTESVA
jgi:uroporphyrinogen-III synthase